MTIKRAIVLIGVQRANGMPKLKAVWDCVNRMKEWALSQDIPPSLIKVITDADNDEREDGQQRDTNDVTISYVKSVIKEFANRGDLDQLIIYYSGHGMSISQNEYWLLTDAMNDDGTEAVNLKGSIEAASYGQVPHVIFISDACRSAAKTTAQQSILPGSLIYPKKTLSGLSKDVDVFYATLLSTAAMEIADAETAAKTYTAVYTDALIEVLTGLHPQALRAAEEGGPKTLVKPRPLKEFLQKHVPLRVSYLLGPFDERSQQPDATVTSGDSAWLSKVAPIVGGTAAPPHEIYGVPGVVGAELVAHAEAAEFFIELSEVTAREAIVGNSAALESLARRSTVMRTKLRGPSAVQLTIAADQFAKEVRRNTEGFGPAHFETGSGFRIRGAKLSKVVSTSDSEVLNDGELVRTAVDGPAASMLLVLNDGRGVVVPAIDRFIGTLTFDDGGLSDIAFEPIDTNERWHDFSEKADDIRQLRAVAAAASRQGRFRLEGENAKQMARRMQLAKGVDPSLALYAAHAYRDQGQRGRLREMADFMQGDLGMCLFDIALLAGMLGENGKKRFIETAFPFLPMLSQTWALLPVYDVELPTQLKHITRHLQPNSLWTLFDKGGVDLISSVIREGQVR